MQDIVVMRVLLPLFFVFLTLIPMVGSAADARDVIQLSAREAARKASISNDSAAVIQVAQDTITGSGKPTTVNGTTVFDPAQDVLINFFDGDRVTVTVSYHHYLLTPNLLSLIGGQPIGPTIDLQSTASFERLW